MLKHIKVGDLVKMIEGFSVPGIVMDVHADYHGAGQAFKIIGHKRGDCMFPNSVNTIMPTQEGKRDRVLVLWPDQGYTYEESSKLEIISEGR